jgi:hypothetical protein
MQVNLTASDKKKVTALIEQDVWLNALYNANFSEIDTFIDNQIIDFANLRRLLKLILKVLVYLLKYK